MKVHPVAAISMIDATVRARMDLSNEAIAKHLRVTVRAVALARKRAEKEIRQTGVNPHLSHASKIAITHGVTVRTAQRWLANNDVPAIKFVKVAGTDMRDITKKRARRTDRDGQAASFCRSRLNSALSFLRAADKSGCRFGICAQDQVRLSNLIATATEMANRWSQVTP